MQAIGRWGNFFNQELYGPPTNLPWGIAIDCAHRARRLPVHAPARGDHALPSAVPVRVDLGDRSARRSCIWLGFARSVIGCARATCSSSSSSGTGSTRFVLENLREDNWTFFGIPTAQIVSLAVIAIGVVGFSSASGRHRSDRPATDPQGATWGALGRRLDDASDRRAVGQPPPPGSDIDDEDDDIDDLDDDFDDDIDDIDDEEGPEPTAGRRAETARRPDG